MKLDDRFNDWYKFIFILKAYLWYLIKESVNELKIFASNVNLGKLEFSYLFQNWQLIPEKVYCIVESVATLYSLPKSPL